MSVIYYGMEKSVDYMKKKVNEWIQITGTPVAFTFKDRTLETMKDSKYLGRFETLSVQAALEKYPDCHIYLVYQSEAAAKSEAARLLAQKVPGERIHFLEADLVYRKGCYRLGHALHFKMGNIPMCTAGNRSVPSFEGSSDVGKIIDDWQSFSSKLIDANQLGIKNKCDGCPQLKHGFYNRKPKLRDLRFMQNLKYDACNLKCGYCFSSTSDRWTTLKNADGPSTYDVIKEFVRHPEYAKMGKEFTVTFANGELCVNRYFEQIMEELSTVQWNIEILSNMSMYRESLAQLMREGRVGKIITSLDSGTRETFKKLKANDRFDQTVENLSKYPFEKTALFIKYVFVEGINDNEADIDGFYQIAKDAGGLIMISADNKTNGKPFTDNEHLRNLTLRIIKKAKADGVKLIGDANNINPVDVKFISDQYKLC